MLAGGARSSRSGQPSSLGPDEPRRSAAVGEGQGQGLWPQWEKAGDKAKIPNLSFVLTSESPSESSFGLDPHEAGEQGSPRDSVRPRAGRRGVRRGSGGIASTHRTGSEE